MKANWVRFNDHLRRLMVSERYFIDHEAATALRQSRDNPYELWESGAGVFVSTRGGKGYNIAAFRGAFRTQALAIAAAHAT